MKRTIVWGAVVAAVLMGLLIAAGASGAQAVPIPDAGHNKMI